MKHKLQWHRNTHPEMARMQERKRQRKEKESERTCALEISR